MAGKDQEKHAFSFMDGIPVKISEMYKPPRKVVLPVGFQNRLLQPPVSGEYDFGLENGILEKLQQWRDLRSSERKQRRDRIAQDDVRLKQLQETLQELSLKDDSPASKNSTPTPPSVTPPVIPQSSSEQPVWIAQPSVSTPPVPEPNPILRPIPIKHQVAQSQANNNKPISAFNISDFEADTSSPFDNMELKTINDLEELAQVLQPSRVTAVSSYYQATTEPSLGVRQAYVNQPANANSNPVTYSEQQQYNCNISGKMHDNTKDVMNTHSHLNGYTSGYGVYNSMPTSAHPVSSYQMNTPVPAYQHQTVIHPVNSRDQVVAYNFVDQEKGSQTTNVPFYPSQEVHRSVYSFYTNSAWPPSDSYRTVQSRHESPAHGYSVDTVGDAALTSTMVNPVSPSSSPLDQLEKVSPHSGSSSSGVDSIVQQLNELMKRSGTSKAAPALPSLREGASSLNSTSEPMVQDPFLSLDSENQHLVQNIAEMGFPRHRVAQACITFEGNDKKMIEYLLSLQSLLDAGYSESRAEHALRLNKQDTEAANRYLEAETQLLDLGFPKERVSDALLKFSCDRDKALDFLIT